MVKKVHSSHPFKLSFTNVFGNYSPCNKRVSKHFIALHPYTNRYHKTHCSQFCQRSWGWSLQRRRQEGKWVQYCYKTTNNPFKLSHNVQRVTVLVRLNAIKPYSLVPAVWSKLGPVRKLPVEPLCLVQSKRSRRDCVHLHNPVSKLQSNGAAPEGDRLHLPTVAVKETSSIAMSPW